MKHGLILLSLINILVIVDEEFGVGRA